MSAPDPTSPDIKPPESLGDLLAAMRPDDGQDRVSVDAVLHRVGSRSFPAFVLVPAVLLVSPLSGIPGTPTLFGLLIVLVTLQALLGRKHLWLPRVIRNRSVSAARMTRALNWLAKPAGWMDRHSHHRLRFLSAAPTRPLAYLFVTLAALSWPLMEILPFVTSFSAGAVAMIMFGVMTRDGAYILAGYIQGALIYLGILTVWIGLI